MTEPSFGQIFNTSAIDQNSQVSFSHCVEAVPYLEQSVSNLYNEPPSVFFSDNYGDREFALLTGAVDSYHLKVYTVTTSGTPAITLSSSTSWTVTTGTFYLMGLKKVGSDYHVYYATTDSTLYPTYLKFGKLVIIPGGSCTDNVIENITLSTTGENPHWEIVTKRTVGRVGNVGLIKWYQTTVFPDVFNDLEVYIYSLDMDSESTSGGLEFSVPSRQAVYDPFLTQTNLVFNESMGSLKWCLGYIDRTTPNLPASHIAVNGSDTKIYEHIDFSNPLNWTLSLISKQYNSSDYLCVMDVIPPTYPTFSHRVKVISGSLGTTVFNPPSETYYNPITFHSNFTFPSIIYNTSDTLYHWVDPTTGLEGSALSVSGVSAIYNLFPTLDLVDGSIYILGVVSGVVKIIGINPLSSAVTRVFDTPLVSFSSRETSFNHGNFFIRWDDTIALKVAYLINLSVLVANHVRGIIEMN
jgi:hypothetical protein